MKKLIFEWDDNKNKTNQVKHGVAFEEAETVFFDEKAIEFDAPDHSIDKERFLLLGFSQTLKIMIVCHYYRDDESIVRIISARKATKKEQKAYFRGV